jgi:hypothetical protein
VQDGYRKRTNPASKAYVRQIRKSESYHLLQPVYGLGIINDTFDHTTEEFYHQYQTTIVFSIQAFSDCTNFIFTDDAY